MERTDIQMIQIEGLEFKLRNPNTYGDHCDNVVEKSTRQQYWDDFRETYAFEKLAEDTHLTTNLVKYILHNSDQSSYVI